MRAAVGHRLMQTVVPSISPKAHLSNLLQLMMDRRTMITETLYLSLFGYACVIILVILCVMFLLLDRHSWSSYLLMDTFVQILLLIDENFLGWIVPIVDYLKWFLSFPSLVAPSSVLTFFSRMLKLDSWYRFRYLCFINTGISHYLVVIWQTDSLLLLHM